MDKKNLLGMNSFGVVVILLSVVWAEKYLYVGIATMAIGFIIWLYSFYKIKKLLD